MPERESYIRAGIDTFVTLAVVLDPVGLQGHAGAVRKAEGGCKIYTSCFEVKHPK